MGDEQTPQSDLIDDAIRQAERQLEAKLEALRMSALGEATPSFAPADDVAILRPTNAAPAPAEQPQDELAPTGDWHEAEGDDLTFTPAGGATMPDTSEVSDLVAVWDEDAESEDADDAPTGSVTFLDDADASYEPEMDEDPVASFEPVEAFDPDRELRRVERDMYRQAAREETAPPAPAPSTGTRPSEAWDRPEPVHSTWTGSGSTREQPYIAPSSEPATPSEDEMQFWAHTRTALRNIQQLADSIPAQVTSVVVDEVERIVREEAAAPAATVRQVQQQVQQGFPRLTERLEGAVEQGAAAALQGIRQLREELPAQLDRSARENRDALREELDRTAGVVHGAVQKDVAQLEQSIATNVTRMAHSSNEAVARVERDVDSLGETVVRFERGVHGELDRVEAQLRSSIERVEQSLRDELVGPAETVRKLDEELPARFGRIERTLTEQLQDQQRDVSNALSSLVDANRAALDRLASIASTLDEDRARRSEDVEVIVDTVTTGWEGLAAAIKALWEQGEQNARRIAGVEQRLGQIRDLEGGVESTMSELRAHIRDLQPAPVMVTVSHPEAEVRNSARGGWLPESSGS